VRILKGLALIWLQVNNTKGLTWNIPFHDRWNFV
jgi:hypothetical protein